MRREVVIAINKHINRKYRVIDEIVAGVVLFGAEIKAIRKYKININHSYVSISAKKEFFLIDAPINSLLQRVPFAQYDCKRIRKLLLTKTELQRWAKKVVKQRLTIIPRTVILNQKNILKIRICLCVGLKTHDRRQLLKKKDLERQSQKEYRSNLLKL